MITVNLYYIGSNGNARKFAEEMETSGTADKIRAELGNANFHKGGFWNYPDKTV